MYSIHNEGKFVVKTLKNEIYKHITAISKNLYFNVLNDIVINTTIHTIKPLK